MKLGFGNKFRSIEVTKFYIVKVFSLSSVMAQSTPAMTAAHFGQTEGERPEFHPVSLYSPAPATGDESASQSKIDQYKLHYINDFPQWNRILSLLNKK